MVWLRPLFFFFPGVDWWGGGRGMRLWFGELVSGSEPIRGVSIRALALGDGILPTCASGRDRFADYLISYKTERQRGEELLLLFLQLFALIDTNPTPHPKKKSPKCPKMPKNMSQNIHPHPRIGSLQNRTFHFFPPPPTHILSPDTQCPPQHSPSFLL